MLLHWIMSYSGVDSESLSKNWAALSCPVSPCVLVIFSQRMRWQVAAVPLFHDLRRLKCAGSCAFFLQGLVVGHVSSPFLCEHETEMWGCQLSLYFRPCGGMRGGFSCCLWLQQNLQHFTTSVYFTTLIGSRGVSLHSVRVCLCGCRCKVFTDSRGRCETSSPPDLLFWLLFSFFLHSGRGFSVLYAHFVYLCLSEH